MIKNRKIIDSLTRDKKLEMIADGNCLADGNPAGVPRVINAAIEEINSSGGEIYPSYGFLANSWDNGIISAVSVDLSSLAKKQGVNLLFTPQGKTKTSPYSAGISEDPYYTAAVLSNVVKSVKDAGIVPCVTGCALTACDVGYMDVFPDGRAIYEFVFRPLNDFADGYGNIFMTSFTRLSGKYEKFNCEGVSKFLHSIAADGGYVICSEVESGLERESVAAGNLFSYKEDLSALKAAVNAEQELSAEKIDETADKIVDLALYCNIGSGRSAGSYDTAAISLKAAEASTVLLKNDGVLPLNGGEKLGVIGQPAYDKNTVTGRNFIETLAINNISAVGAAQGYTVSDGRCDELLNEAVELAKNCDAVILFLGLDKTAEEEFLINRRLKLPANRLALVNALKSTGVKIIAVLTTHLSVDLSFDGAVSALMVSPLSCTGGAQALVNILKGKSPCGKLANTLYAEADGYFEKIKRDKDCGRIRIGTFMGYRYYSTAGIAVKYPFGHGLGYTQFAYSDLTVHGDQVLLTVKNTGNTDGSEVVQLYTGKPDSQIIRPVKELKGYMKVSLKAGEEKTLRFVVPDDSLAVYCPDKGKFVTENGSYDIYAGSSVNDIRLTGKMNVCGTSLKRDSVKLSDYIPTISNVVEGGYTLAPVHKVAAGGKKLKFAGLILMLAAALGAVIFAVLNLVQVMSFDSVAAVPVLTIDILIFIAGAVLLITDFLKTRAADTNSGGVFAGRPETVKIETDSIDSLFEQEFGEETSRTENDGDSKDGNEEILKFLDEGPDFKLAAENLRTFFAERGLAVDTSTARKTISAFAASRLILLKCADNALCGKFLDLLCGFFGTAAVKENYGRCDGVKDFLNLGNGSILNAINSAAQEKQNIVPVCIENAEISGIGGVIAPFEKYFKNPESAVSVNDGGKEILLPHNLWFVFSLSENSFLSDADMITSEYCSVIEPDFAAAKEKDIKSEIDVLGSYRLKKLSDTARREYTLDEDRCWKKVDKLEKYINSHTPFAIDNKRWQAMERFVSAYLACGGEEQEALDNMTAAQLAVTACAKLNGKLKPSDGTVLSAVENIFGEEKIPATKKILKYSGQAVRRARNAFK